MTLEQLLSKEEDSTLLSIYTELSTRIVPATGYAHAYVRKVNKMIDAGKLCIREDTYRKIYIPTLAKAVLKEMANRWAIHLCYDKAPSFTSVQNGAADDGVAKCAWCGEEFEANELHGTDLGCLCETCITAIRSRGEQVTVYD